MNCVIFAKKNYKKQNERKSWELTVCAVAVHTTRGTSFFGWNVKNISKFCQMITWHGIEMPDISKWPFNQEVFKKMVGFLTDVSNKMSSFKNWSQDKKYVEFTKGNVNKLCSKPSVLLSVGVYKQEIWCPFEWDAQNESQNTVKPVFDEKLQ